VTDVAVASVTAPRRGVVTRLRRSEHVAGWTLSMPATILIGIFGVLPIIWSAVLSFQQSNLLSPSTPFVGTANYRQLIHDPVFHESIVHTVVYSLMFVPVTMIVGLLIAVALNRNVRGISFYRSAAYVTMAVSTINEAIIFLWLFDPTFGGVNSLLTAIGLPAQQWLASTNEALFVIVVMTVWGWTGFAVIIYLAALQGVPQEVLDAAAIDGAKPWKIFRTITVPLVSPASLFLAVWLTINALQLFDEVYMTTKGGPLFATNVIVYYLWNQAFVQFNAGYAAAMAYVLFLAILVITYIQFRVGRRYVHYGR
jgi:multiple sugar transport system permease protein